MSSSRDYYKSSRDPARDALPPIRDVLGDQLDFPPPRDNAYSFDAVHRALPETSGSRSRSTWPQSGPTLPPIHNSRSHGYATTPHTPLPSSSRGHPQHSYSHSHSQHPPSSHSRSQHPPSSHSHHAPPPHAASSHPPGGGAPYSFDVFRPSSSGLVHASSSSRSQGILRTTRADAGRKYSSQAPADEEEEPDDGHKKHVCNRCGKRFGRPSSLKTHEVVHSEEKPFECSECGKAFSVASNMRRHFRKTHQGNAVSGSWSADDEDESYYASGSGARGGYGDDAHMPASSSAAAAAAASGSGSKGYYTSSRR